MLRYSMRSNVKKKTSTHHQRLFQEKKHSLIVDSWVLEHEIIDPHRTRIRNCCFGTTLPHPVRTVLVDCSANARGEEVLLVLQNHLAAMCQVV
jgi:hypothetical protein